MHPAGGKDGVHRLLTSGDHSVEDICRIICRIDVICLAACDDGVNYCSALRCIVVAGKQVVFTPKFNRANTVFHLIVVDLQLAIRGIYPKFLPLIQLQAGSRGTEFIRNRGFSLLRNTREYTLAVMQRSLQ